MSKQRMIEDQIKHIERMVIEKLIKKKTDWTVPWQTNLRSNERAERKQRDLAKLTKKYSAYKEEEIESHLRQEYLQVPVSRKLSATALKE